jgi:polysaccharide biosynthesis/export protein
MNHASVTIPGCSTVLLSWFRAGAVLALLLLCAAATKASDVKPLPGSQPSAASDTPIPQAAFLTSMDSLDDIHRLAIGDRLSFRIIEDLQDPDEPREPRQLVVTDSGELEVPYIGRFPAEKKTCKQLAQELKAALEQDYYHQATVIVAIDLRTRSRGKVYLVGPVRVPGPQDMPSDEVLTIGKAIMRAGGFGDFADKRNVRLTRQGTARAGAKTITVDVAEILERGRVDRDIPLEAGDLILIPERAIRF